MLDDFRIIAACCAVIVGMMVAWANPSRRLNRTFLAFSVFVGAWLFSQWRAGHAADGLWWVRMAFALSVGVVLMIWLIKQTLAEPEQRVGSLGLHFMPWLILGLGLVWICFTPHFVPETSTGEKRQFGWGYFAFLATLAAMVAGILAQAQVQARSLTGVRRLELQLLLLNSVAAASAVIILVLLGFATGNPVFNLAQPIFVLAFYFATSWAIVTTRILDARHVLMVGLAKLMLMGVVAILGWALFYLLELIMPVPVVLLIVVGAGLAFASVFEPMIRHAFRLHQSDVESRNAAHAVARQESHSDRLVPAFVKVLLSWAKSERAVILSGGANGFFGCGIELAADTAVLRALRHLRWATPERLSRERPTAGRAALGSFFQEQQLGLIVLCEGPALSVLVGVGVAASRKPFTYPQVTQLTELASIMESALERAHFSEKAQHAEQLATVGLLGASLAHEIRNPLVSIKAFVQLLPKHHHDPVFREKFFGLIGEEVSRIDRLTEQLMDLASPKNYSAAPFGLHAFLNGGIDLITPKADDKNIKIIREFNSEPDTVFTDATAAKQVFLNLCFNAIQAVEHMPDNRWVKISTLRHESGVELAIADSGPGIAPEVQLRLFQPFHSTKSSGFGLGLAICSDILRRLNATIAVDPPVAGKGAVFRVTFPCQPFSS